MLPAERMGSMKDLVTKPKFIQKLGVLILVALMLFGGQPVFAINGANQEIRTETFTLEDFDIPTDQNFQGVQVDRTFNLYLPEDWAILSDA
ncbi:MAG: hypothetical protein ACOCYU_02365, partial [Brevefilum sp.]